MAALAFTLSNVDSGEIQHLDAFLSLAVEQCFVEFLFQNEHAKPHVVFKLNVGQGITHGGRDYQSCRLDMEYVTDDLPGEFQIKLVDYTGPSWGADASFQFPVRRRYTVLDWINIFRGQHRRCPRDHQSDFTVFNFVQALPTQDMVGCRDFIAQCMIRLNVLRVVGWEIVGQAVPNIRFIDFERFIPTNHFHHIIANLYEIQGYNFEAEDDNPRPCVITRFPLFRARFNDPEFQRIEVHQVHHHNYRLPYHDEPDDPNQGDMEY